MPFKVVQDKKEITMHTQPYARMRTMMLVLTIVTALVLIGGSLAATSGTAYASSTHTNSSVDAGGTVDFTAMQKWCAVIEVHLNGAQHTVTCLQTYKSKGPYLGRVNCSFV